MPVTRLIQGHFGISSLAWAWNDSQTIFAYLHISGLGMVPLQISERASLNFPFFLLFVLDLFVGYHLPRARSSSRCSLFHTSSWRDPGADILTAFTTWTVEIQAAFVFSFFGLRRDAAMHPQPSLGRHRADTPFRLRDGLRFSFIFLFFFPSFYLDGSLWEHGSGGWLG